MLEDVNLVILNASFPTMAKQIKCSIPVRTNSVEDYRLFSRVQSTKLKLIALKFAHKKVRSVKKLLVSKLCRYISVATKSNCRGYTRKLCTYMVI